MKPYRNFLQTDTARQIEEWSRQRPAIATLFEQNPQRARQFVIETPSYLIDYSKTHLDDRVLALADRLAEELHFDEQIEALLNGQKVNLTENRPALHTALRLPEGRPLIIDGRDITHEIGQVRQRMRQWAEALHQQKWIGATGKPLKYIVNIGIGGSFLGPLTVTEILHDRLRLPVTFLSNVDDEHLQEIASLFPPEETLYVVVSKSFGTPETLKNARYFFGYFQEKYGGDAISKHFIGVTAHPGKAREWGIPANRILPMWDFVGGRFSLWSAAGVSIALSLGYDTFDQLLAGAHRADEDLRLHTRTADNPARLFAFLTLLYRHYSGYQSEVYLPYRQRMKYLPFYLQQLIMESNGKSIQRNAKPVHYDTAPVIWGDTGTNAQHSFFQALHQGTIRTLPYFLGDVQSATDFKENRRFLLANLLSQSESLAFGREADSPFNRFEGNRPSVTWLFARLDAGELGYLLATFEHKTYLESLYWNINAFDQPGVELGKINAKKYDEQLAAGRPTGHPLTDFILKHQRD